jgi:hypothetical protein
MSRRYTVLGMTNCRRPKVEVSILTDMLQPNLIEYGDNVAFMIDMIGVTRLEDVVTHQKSKYDGEA